MTQEGSVKGESPQPASMAVRSGPAVPPDESGTESSARPGAREWLWSILRGSRAALRDALLVSLFVNLLALAVPVFVLQVYDRVVFHAGLTTLEGLVIGMALAIGFDYVLRAGRSRVFQAVAVRVDVGLGRMLYDRLMATPMRLLEARPSAHWHALFRDVEAVRNALAGPTAALAVDLPFAILFLIVIFVIATPVAWVLMVMLPLFLILAWRSGASMGKASDEEREVAMVRENLLNEIIMGRATVKALALDDAIRPRWEDRHASTVEMARNRGRTSDGHQVLAHVMMLGTTVAMTTAGALAILDQQMTMGSLIAANMLSSRLIAPMSQLVGQWHSFVQLRQSVARLDAAFRMPEERRRSGIEMPRPQGHLRIEKLSFHYRKDSPAAIDGIDGQIGAKGLHAIVGRNGSGKSTLLKLLRGLYQPEGGRVLIDGADIAQFTRMELARWIGYLPQECTLFAGSVRDNIAIVHPEAGDEEVIEAAKLAQVHPFIIDLPDGYGTNLGEGGGGLSGGQQQRIALARALLTTPPVLLLDEPTSNLDGDAEKELAATIRRLAERCTVIAVTHSPVLLAACDSILVMERGKVALAGPAMQVLTRLRAGPPTPIAAGAGGLG